MDVFSHIRDNMQPAKTSWLNAFSVCGQVIIDATQPTDYKHQQQVPSVGRVIVCVAHKVALHVIAYPHVIIIYVRPDHFITSNASCNRSLLFMHHAAMPEREVGNLFATNFTLIIYRWKFNFFLFLNWERIFFLPPLCLLVSSTLSSLKGQTSVEHVLACRAMWSRFSWL